jgi:hypothetical protein
LHSDGRAPVYHRPLERLVDYCLQRYDRVDGGSLIIRVAVTSLLWTKLFFAPIYINTVLTTTLSCLFTIQNEHRFMLQQGNAMVFVQHWCHVSTVEYIGDELRRRVRCRQHKPTNLVDLR